MLVLGICRTNWGLAECFFGIAHFHISRFVCLAQLVARLARILRDADTHCSRCFTNNHNNHNNQASIPKRDPFLRCLFRWTSADGLQLRELPLGGGGSAVCVRGTDTNSRRLLRPWPRSLTTQPHGDRGRPWPGGRRKTRRTTPWARRLLPPGLLPSRSTR